MIKFRLKMAAAKGHDNGETLTVNSSGVQNTTDLAMLKRSSADHPVLEPLCFPEPNTKARFSIPLFCLLCDKMFKDSGMEKSDALLHHLLVEHQFVIADVELIADFKSYIHYWKRRFRESPITDFCSVININSKAEDIGPKVQYNLLCDGLPEDKQMREHLQISKLQDILHYQQKERTDGHFSRNCLFCNAHFEGNRSVLFQHMVDNHSFNVGLPDNLVYVNELLDKLEEKLKNLQCLFCEKTFKDRSTLRDHMRKKQHKKINPKNKEFDKYYLINYLEVGKNWHDILDEDDSEINQKSKDESWEDWQEESIPIHCLFCEVTLPLTQDILTHMKECHSFDLLKIKKIQGLNFYEEVKIVNYIRRQVYNCRCIFCKEKFSSKETLLCHLREMSHFELPDKNSSWDQPQYFFPTFENDGLLCGLPDEDDEDYCEDIDEKDVSCEIHDENYSHHDETISNFERNYYVNNKQNDGVNICKKNKDDGGNDNSNGVKVFDHDMVGNDKQPNNNGSNDCENVHDHMLGRDDESKDELKNENECLGLLVNNEGDEGDHQSNFGSETQNYGEIQDADAGRTDGDNRNVSDICKASDKQAYKDVSCGEVDNERHIKVFDDHDHDHEVHSKNNSCSNTSNIIGENSSRESVL